MQPHGFSASRRSVARGVFLSFPVVLGLALIVAPAHGVSGRYPSLDALALMSERVELVRVVPPMDTSHAPLLVAGRLVHYRAITRIVGDGPSPGSVRLHVYGPGALPLEGDTVLVFWQIWNHPQLRDPNAPRDITVVNLTDLQRSSGQPALTGDFRVFNDRDSILATVLFRGAMLRYGCPLGDGRRLSLVDFVEGKGVIDRWMPPESAANDAANPFNVNVLITPADSTIAPSCRRLINRHLRTQGSEVPLLRRAANMALMKLRGGRSASGE